MSTDDPTPHVPAQALRREYTRGELLERDALPDAIAQFERWFNDALAAAVNEPNAMTLATADADGAPHARVVLLKGFDQRGFAFYTNYDSQKGVQLAANPRAALVFYWAPLERQVRIEGWVEKVTPEESEAYFRTRPRGAQIGAWGPMQSRILPTRETLDDKIEQVTRQLEGKPVPLPPHWGGYRVVPTAIEFWQGRPSRLHDRLEYVRDEQGAWNLRRLSP